jgi:hypothetical protein
MRGCAFWTASLSWPMSDSSLSTCQGMAQCDRQGIASSVMVQGKLLSVLFRSDTTGLTKHLMHTIGSWKLEYPGCEKQGTTCQCQVLHGNQLRHSVQASHFKPTAAYCTFVAVHNACVHCVKPSPVVHHVCM